MDEEVTHWITKLARGDSRAAQRIWEQYFEQLVRLARSQLRGLPRRVADEEDVALSVIDSLCRGLTEHRFEWVKDSTALWKLLVTMTAYKVSTQRRRYFSQKRGSGRVRGESLFEGHGEKQAADDGIGGVLGREPNPQFATMLADQTRAFLTNLQDDTLRQVATLTLEGHSTDEIAGTLGCSQRQVQRKLKTILDICALESRP